MLVSGRTADTFREEMRSAVEAIRPVYAHVVLECSDYSNTYKDRIFFEALIATLANTCICALSFLDGNQGVGAHLEENEPRGDTIMNKMVHIDIGRIFRTDYFNIPRRVESQNRVIDMLTIEQLYQLRHVELQVNMSAELQASLNERPKLTSGLHESYAATSGLVAKLLKRPAIKAGVVTDKHMEKTEIEMHFDPLPPDTNKSSSMVPASSPLELKTLEDKRMELLRFGEPQRNDITTRTPLSSKVNPPLDATPSRASEI